MCIRDRNNITHRKLRSWLTMIGIFIGIAAVVALVAVGQGLEKSITEQFKQLGTDKLFIQPKGQIGGIPSIDTAAQLTKEDVKTVSRTKGIEIASGMVAGVVKIEFEDEVSYQLLTGVEEEAKELYKEFADWQIEIGREVEEKDKNKVALGYSYGAKKIFSKPVNVRDRIKLNNNEFRVSGIYKKIGNPQDDAQIYTNEKTARELLGLDDEVHFIIAKVSSGKDARVIAESVKKELRKERNLKKGNEDFTVQTFEELIESFQKILYVVQAVLIGIAAISLIVGGVGIMNTMYAAVLQRTQEIGILKAIGARNSSILALFLIESGLLGLFGGIIGTGIGIGIAKVIETIADKWGLGVLKVYFPWYLILGIVLFSFSIGAISGVMPAMRAAKLKPVDALRYE